jgi:branched-chain amino acid aminotransferase
MKAWVNGRIVPQEEATVPILSHSMSRGSAVFEVLDLVPTAKGPAIFRAGAHTERLFGSAESLHMVMPVTQAELIDAMKQTVRANGLTDGGIKVFAYLSQVAYDLMPRSPRMDVAIFCYDFAATFGLSREQFSKPISASVSRIRKLKPSTVPVHAKAAGYYVNGMLARWEARQKGFDDAILLDDAGNAAEAPVSSLFVVASGIVRTPRLDNVLAGITRDSVIQVTRDLGIRLEETDIPAADLAAVDEAFFTGTHIRVEPIRAIDARQLEPCPGPVTARIQKAFEEAYSGCNARYGSWLDYV